VSPHGVDTAGLATIAVNVDNYAPATASLHYSKPLLRPSSCVDDCRYRLHNVYNICLCQHGGFLNKAERGKKCHFILKHLCGRLMSFPPCFTSSLLLLPK